MKFTPIITTLGLLTAFLFCLGCSQDNDWDDVMNDIDNCVELYNPSQTDEDDDGFGEPCDVSTPHHGLAFDGCYFSTWSELVGPGATDLPTKIVQQNDTRLDATLIWSADTSVEQGLGQTNGVGIWFMAKDEDDPKLFTHTYVEGLGFDLDADGYADEIEGDYKMVECNSPIGLCAVYPDFQYFSKGVWSAVRVADEECE